MYFCNGKHCSSTSLHGWYTTHLSLESSKNKNKKRRRGEIINIPAVFHYVTVRDKIVIGFLLRRWCLKEYLYSWLVFIFMNKFMSQTSWLASYSQISQQKWNFEGGWQDIITKGGKETFPLHLYLTVMGTKLKHVISFLDGRRNTFQWAVGLDTFYHDVVWALKYHIRKKSFWTLKCYFVY